MSAEVAAAKAAKSKTAKSAADWRDVLVVVVVIVLVVAFLVLIVSPSSAVYLMRGTAGTLGFGAGAAVGSVPTFAHAVVEGIQAAR